MDDEDLYREIVDTLCGLGYACAKEVLETGVKFDYAHFWEDICFKNGPLISPDVFREFVGPWYKKITDLTSSYGIEIVSVDCDGMIDSLIPVSYTHLDVYKRQVSVHADNRFPITAGKARNRIHTGDQAVHGLFFKHIHEFDLTVHDIRCV